MSRYRKRFQPEAWQFDLTTAPEWVMNACSDGTIQPGPQPRGALFIKTLEGVLTCDIGDWLIQGPKGEIYPCKPDIFAETYEPADAPQVIMDQLTDAILHGQGTVEIRHVPFAAELTPEQQKAFEEEWSKPHSGYITWNNDLSKPCPVSVDPGPALGEHLTDIDAPDMPLGMPILPPGWSQDVNTGMVTDDHGQAQGVPLDWIRDATAEVNERYTRFRDELEHLINSFSMENGSDTPDFILAAFMVDQLMAFDTLMQKRDGWYGGSHWKLKSQLEAEGAHTEAANAEIERLKQPNHTTELLDPTSHPD